MALMRAGRQRVSAGPKDGGHGPTGQPAAALLGPAALTAASVGMWSAVLLAILNVWFWVAFILYEPALQASWRGMGAYMAMFIPARYLAWAVPAFLIAPAFLIMIACLHAWANEVQRTWSLLALVFALPGATLMAALYYIQMTVVPVNLSHGLTDGLRLWIYAPPTHSPFRAPWKVWAMASKPGPFSLQPRSSRGTGCSCAYAGPSVPPVSRPWWRSSIR